MGKILIRLRVNLIPALAAILLPFLIPFALASEIVVVEESEAWAYRDGSGFAPKLFEAIKEAGGPDLELQVLPFARALQTFESNKAPCYLGGDKKAALDYLNLNVLEAAPIFEGAIYVFTLKNEPLIKDSNQLNSLRVGVLRGLNTSILKLEGANPDFIPVNTTVQNTKMLTIGRVDAIISYKAHLTQEFLSSVHYDPGLILYQSREALICHPSKINEVYIDEFNQALSALRKSGIYQRIYKKYYSGI